MMFHFTFGVFEGFKEERGNFFQEVNKPHWINLSNELFAFCKNETFLIKISSSRTLLIASGSADANLVCFPENLNLPDQFLAKMFQASQWIKKIFLMIC